jgi:hypothetical protein
MDELLLVVLEESVKVTDAKTPSGIAMLFKPQTRQVTAPEALLQESDLFAASGPAAKVADVKSVVE